MRRILLILTVAALMAAMMVSAGPAKADSFGNESNVNNGLNVVQFGGDTFVSFGDDDDFIDDGVFFLSSDSVLGEFDPAGIDIDF